MLMLILKYWRLKLFSNANKELIREKTSLNRIDIPFGTLMPQHRKN